MILSLLICTLLTAAWPVMSLRVEAREEPPFTVPENGPLGKGAFHAFGWSYSNVHSNADTFVGRYLFDTIMVSPVQVTEASGRDDLTFADWELLYTPSGEGYHFDENSPLGTKADFALMCSTTEIFEMEPRIVVEVVLNDSITYDNFETQKADLTAFLMECIDAGADGFYFKHISTLDPSATLLSEIIPELNFHYAREFAWWGEMDNDVASSTVYAYRDLMKIHHCYNSYSLRTAVRNNNAVGAAVSPEGLGYTYEQAIVPTETPESYFADYTGDEPYVTLTDLEALKVYALTNLRQGCPGLLFNRPDPTAALGSASYATNMQFACITSINSVALEFPYGTETVTHSGQFVLMNRGNQGLFAVYVGGSTSGYANLNVPASNIESIALTDRISGAYTTITAGGRFTCSIPASIGVMAAYKPCTHSWTDTASNMHISSGFDCLCPKCGFAPTHRFDETGHCRYVNCQLPLMSGGFWWNSTATTSSEVLLQIPTGNGLYEEYVLTPVEPGSSILGYTGFAQTTEIVRVIDGDRVYTLPYEDCAVYTDGVKTGELHQYRNVVTDFTLKSAGTCARNEVHYQTCRVCHYYGDDEAIFSVEGTMTDEHVYELYACKDCGTTQPQEERAPLAVYDNSLTQWDKVYAYAWNGSSGVQTLGDWPGREMTYVGDNLWMIDYPGMADSAMIIFNNGQGTQTADLNYSTCTLYCANRYASAVYTEPYHYWEQRDIRDGELISVDAATHTGLFRVNCGYCDAIGEESALLEHADENGDRVCDLCPAITITADTFPDAQFLAYILEVVDTDGDGFLSTAETEAVVSMELSNRGIADLTGLARFTSLQSLIVTGNQLTQLDATALSQLTTLICADNRLSVLKVAGLTALETLDCSSNCLTALDLTGCSILQLSADNQLPSIALADSALVLDMTRFGDPTRITVIGEGMIYDPATGLLTLPTLTAGEAVQVTYQYATGCGELSLPVTLTLYIGHASLEYCSITLGGEIGVNFYMNLDDTILTSPNAYLRFTLPNGRIIDVPVCERTSVQRESILYSVYTCYLKATQMTDEIRAQIFGSDGYPLSEEYRYSVVTYANALLASDVATPEAIALVQALLNYGAAAQEHFNYRTETPANAALSEEDRLTEAIDGVDFTAWKPVVDGSAAGLTYYGSSTLLESNTVIRHYFVVAEGYSIQDYTFTVEGRICVVGEKDGMYYVDIPGIEAHNLSRMYLLEISGAEGTQTIAWSVYTYIASVTRSDAYSPEAKAVVATAYRYAEATILYKNSTLN